MTDVKGEWYEKATDAIPEGHKADATPIPLERPSGLAAPIPPAHAKRPQGMIEESQRQLRHIWYTNGFYDYLARETRKPPAAAKRQYFKGLINARQLLMEWERGHRRSYKSELSAFFDEQKDIDARIALYLRNQGIKKPNLKKHTPPCYRCSAAVLCRDYDLACNVFFHWAALPGGRKPTTMRKAPSHMYHGMTFKHEGKDKGAAA